MHKAGNQMLAGERGLKKHGEDQLLVLVDQDETSDRSLAGTDRHVRQCSAANAIWATFKGWAPNSTYELIRHGE